MIKNYWNRGVKQKFITVIVALVIVALLFFLRDDYQPVLLFFRKFVFIILLCALVLFFGLRSFRKSASALKRVFILVGLLVFFCVLYLVGWQLRLYDYM